SRHTAQPVADTADRDVTAAVPAPAPARTDAGSGPATAADRQHLRLIRHAHPVNARPMPAHDSAPASGFRAPDAEAAGLSPRTGAVAGTPVTIPGARRAFAPEFGRPAWQRRPPPAAARLPVSPAAVRWQSARHADPTH